MMIGALIGYDCYGCYGWYSKYKVCMGSIDPINKKPISIVA